MHYDYAVLIAATTDHADKSYFFEGRTLRG